MSPILRADREIAIEDFGRSRVAEGIAVLNRRHGVSILTEAAQEELLSLLEADAELHERINAQNRARRQEHA